MPGEASPGQIIDHVTPIKATELRAHMRSILERARFQEERFLVCTHGQPMAVLVGVDEYLRLEAIAEEKGNLSSSVSRPARDREPAVFMRADDESGQLQDEG